MFFTANRYLLSDLLPIRKFDVFMLILATSMLTLTGFVLAAPLPPEIIINDTTKECSMLIGGDECTDYTPLSGWQSLG
jgi:hypothetical protein